MISLSLLVLQVAADDVPKTWAQENPLLLGAFFAMFMVVVYTMMVGGPEKKRRKAKEQLLNTLERGDAVVTIGGLHGKVVSSKDETVMIKVDKDVTLEFSVKAIANVQRKGEEIVDSK